MGQRSRSRYGSAADRAANCEFTGCPPETTTEVCTPLDPAVSARRPLFSVVQLPPGPKRDSSEARPIGGTRKRRANQCAVAVLPGWPCSSRRQPRRACGSRQSHELPALRRARKQWRSLWLPHDPAGRSLARVGLLSQLCGCALVFFDDHVLGFRGDDLLYVSDLMPGPDDELCWVRPRLLICL